MAMLYNHSIEISCTTRWWCLKCVIVYLARDIPAFVMYCVYGESGSSLLIESTDSMINFSFVAVNTYVPIFRGLDALGGIKLRTDTRTHTCDNYSNDNNYIKIIRSTDALYIHMQKRSTLSTCMH